MYLPEKSIHKALRFKQKKINFFLCNVFLSIKFFEKKKKTNKTLR